jgi:broad specificity phosphatase PhoE
MRTLEVRRHSWTLKDRQDGDPHLSPAGVRLARAVGDTLPSMAYVAVGDQPRHGETAEAMGYAVDEQVAWPSGYVEGEVRHHDQWSWDAPYARYAELLRTGGGLTAVAGEHLAHWRRILAEVPEGGAALVVSSGGSIEPALVAAFPQADHESWGEALHHLDGATLTVDGDSFMDLELRRLASIRA